MTEEDRRRAVEEIAARLRHSGHSGDAVQVLCAFDEACRGNLGWEAAATIIVAAVVKLPH